MTSSSYEQNEYVPPHKIGFFGAILGLIFAPSATVRDLLAAPGFPKYGFSIPIFFLLCLVSPTISQHRSLELSYIPIIAIGVFLVSSYILFLLLESWLLFIFAVDISPSRLFAIVGYCAAPLTAGLFLLYIVDYIATGRLELLFALNLGDAPQAQLSLKWLCVFEIGVILLTLLVFLFGLKYAGDLSWPSAILFLFLSIIPFTIAFMGGIFIATKINPSFVSQFEGLLVTPLKSLWALLVNPFNSPKMKFSSN